MVSMAKQPLYLVTCRECRCQFMTLVPSAKCLRCRNAAIESKEGRKDE